MFSFNVCVSFSIFKHSVPSPELLVSLERAEYEVLEGDAGNLRVCVVVQSGALDGSVGASVRVSVPTTEGNTATVQSELYTIMQHMSEVRRRVCIFTEHTDALKYHFILILTPEKPFSVENHC